MSVVFFECDELANVGAVMTGSFYGGVSQQCDQAAEWLAAFSKVNARAYCARYPKEKAEPVTKAALYEAIYARFSKPRDKAAAWSSASLFRYNTHEAKPTAEELHTMCNILEKLGRAMFDK